MQKHEENLSVLVAEDDAVTRRIISGVLLDRGCRVSTARDGLEALHIVKNQCIDVALVDLRMPKMSGLMLLQNLRDSGSDTLPIVISSAGIDEAVTAMSEGAYWYIQKPIDKLELLQIIEDARDQIRINRANTAMFSSNGTPEQNPVLIGISSAVTALRSSIHVATQSNKPVFLQGQLGSGMGSLAQHIHMNSSRAARPMVWADFRSLDRGSVSSRIYGKDFSTEGAPSRGTTGSLELANGGSFYAAGAERMPLEFQRSFAEFIETGKCLRLGSQEQYTSDCRIITSSEENIEVLKLHGLFVPRLAEVISKGRIVLPPLRERISDIPFITESHIQRICMRENLELLIDSGALERLTECPWHGNIKQLLDVLELAAHRVGNGVIRADDLHLEPIPYQQNSPGLDTLNLKNLEKVAIQTAMKKAGNKRKDAALILGISNKTLYNKLRQMSTYDTRGK